MAFDSNSSSPDLNVNLPLNGQLGSLPRNESEILYSSITPEGRSLFGTNSNGRLFAPTDTIQGVINRTLFGNNDLNNVRSELNLPSARMTELTSGTINEYTKEFQTGITQYPYLQIFVVVTNHTRLKTGDQRDKSTTKSVGLLIEGRKVFDEIEKTVGDYGNKISSGIDSIKNIGSDIVGLIPSMSPFAGTIIKLGKTYGPAVLESSKELYEKAKSFKDEPSNNSSAFNSAFGAAVADLTRQETRLLASYALPMPLDHTVNGSLKWSGVNAGSLRGLALETESQAAIGSKLSDNSNFTSELVGKVLGRTALNIGSKVFGGDSDMTDKQFVDKATGTLANPRPTQVFDGTDLRSFTFTWLLSPKNRREAIGLLDLIENLRYYAHPEFADETKTYMRFPSEFELEFRLPSGAKNKSIPSIKRCVMTGINVQYNPGNGRWTTFLSNDPNESLPTHIQLQLSFSEVTTLTKEDIQKGF